MRSSLGVVSSHGTLLSELWGFGRVAGAHLRLYLGQGSQAAISLYTLDICTALSFPTPGDSLYPLPFHLTRGPPTSELEVSLEIAQPPHFTAWRERPREGKELGHTASQPVGTELGLEAEASEPARSFPGLQSISWPLSYLVSSH